MKIEDLTPDTYLPYIEQLKDKASIPGMKLENVRHLLSLNDVRLARILIENQNLPENMLLEMAEHESPRIYRALSRQEDLPPSVVKKLLELHDTDDLVVTNLIEASDLLEDITLDVIEELVNKNPDNLFITRAILGKDIPKELVEKIWLNWGLKSKVMLPPFIKNKNTPVYILENISFQDDINQEIAMNLIASPKVNYKIFHNLSTHPEMYIRSQVADSKKAPKDILKNLAIDPQYYVSQKALWNLKENFDLSGEEDMEFWIKAQKLLKAKEVDRAVGMGYLGNNSEKNIPASVNTDLELLLKLKSHLKTL